MYKNESYRNKMDVYFDEAMGNALEELADLLKEYIVLEKGPDDLINSSIYKTLYLDTIGTLVSANSAGIVNEIGDWTDKVIVELDATLPNIENDLERGFDRGARFILQEIVNRFNMDDVDMAFEYNKQKFVNHPVEDNGEGDKIS